MEMNTFHVQIPYCPAAIIYWGKQFRSRLGAACMAAYLRELPL